MDEDEITFVDEQMERECTCPVCLSVFESGGALQFNCCGCHVCKGCHQGLVKSEGNCPMCRKQDFNASEDKYFVQRVVRGAQVCCINKSKGCDWQGELRHCDDHIKKCEKSDTKCKLCDIVVPFHLQKTHLSDCEGVSINCPNRCQSPKVKRKNIQQHLENTCSLRVSEYVSGSNYISRIMPIPITITKFSSIINRRKIWCSPPFYTHQKGYKFVLCIATQNNSLSVFVRLLKGENDDILKWPIVATFDVEIHNWKNENNFPFKLFLTGDAFCQQVRNESSLFAGWNGNPELMYLALLTKTDGKNFEFLKYDSVTFNIKGIQFRSLPSIPQLPPWINDCTSYFTIPSCSELIKNKCDFYGFPFTSSSNGYKLCLRASLAGKGKGKGTHISLYAQILPSPNDDALPWPFNADVNVSLMNWKGNFGHNIKKRFSFNNAVDESITGRVKDSNTAIMSDGLGLEQFCEHSLLAPIGNMQFLNNDCLILKIDSVVTYSSPPQASPFQFTVTEFSKRKQHNSSYYSRPLYTHAKGYRIQFCISTNENSLSCFAFLMTGENDEKLEWPFRADIVVELVGCRDATKCHSKIISFTSDVLATSCSRVTEKTPCTGFGISDFISLSNLSSDYIRNDSLTFRITNISVYSNALIKKVPRWQSRQFQYLDYNITGYSNHKKLGTKYLSPTFYTHQSGYKMRLEVEFPSTSNKDMAVRVRLLRGEHDSTLQWPFTGNIHVELINWRQDKNHHSVNTGFHEHLPANINGRISQGNAAPLCYGFATFIEGDNLLQSGDQIEYLQEDCLKLRVKKTSTYSKLEKQPYWEHRTPLSNFEFTIGDFTKRMEMNNCFYSSPFFTSAQGYKMCLKIYPNGYGAGQGSHVSVFACFLPGEYDDFLQWPFEGDVIIDVLNWREDRHHFRKAITLNTDVPLSNRSKVNDFEMNPGGWGLPQCIPHSNLFSQNQPHLNHAIYVEEGKYVRFRVKDVIIYRTPLISKSPSWKGWLSNSKVACEFTVTNFSKHKEYDTKRYSPEFYTHKNGYKLRLEVTPFGMGDSSGRNLSVFVRLLKGEFDASLKWPMNIEVPIELVNWRKNSFHLHKTLKIGNNASLSATSRVFGDRANECWGYHDFCSHTTLISNTRDIMYVVDEDCLYFRVKQPTVHSKRGIFA